MGEHEPRPIINPEHESSSSKEGQEFQYEIMTNAEQWMELAKRVDNLIKNVADEKIENLIFLDKSARPVAMLCSDLWKKRFPTKDRPKISFMNIGTELMGETVDRFGRGEPSGEYEEGISEEEIEHVRKEYAHLSSAPDGSKAMIVDEYSWSGRSMTKAIWEIRRAFPQLEISNVSLSDKYDNLWMNEEGVRNPPWGVQEHFGPEPGYGMTGVVDDEDRYPPSLTAMSFRRYIQQFENENDELKSEIKQLGQELGKEIAQLHSKLEPLLSFDNDNVLNNVREGSSKQFRERVGPFLKRYFDEKLFPSVKSIDDEISDLSPIEAREEVVKGVVSKADSMTPENARYMGISFERLTSPSDRLPGSVLDTFKKPTQFHKSHLDEYFIDKLTSEKWPQSSKGEPLSRHALLDYLESYQSSYFKEFHKVMAPLDKLEWEIERKLSKLAKNEKNRKIVKETYPKVKKLRQEMHAIAEEYWTKNAGD